MNKSKLTENDIKYLEKLSQEDSKVEKLLREYKLFSEEDIAKKFRYKLVTTLDAICYDLDAISEGRLDDVKLLNSEDKMFEKIWKMYESGEKIIPIIEYGKDGYVPKAKRGKKEEEAASKQVAL